MSKTDGELVECSSNSLSLFSNSSKDLGFGLGPLTLKMVPCFQLFEDYVLNFYSGSLFFTLCPVLVIISNYEIGSLLELRISVIQL